jgi:hypothetical protein
MIVVRTIDGTFKFAADLFRFQPSGRDLISIVREADGETTALFSAHTLVALTVEPS